MPRACGNCSQSGLLLRSPPRLKRRGCCKPHRLAFLRALVPLLGLRVEELDELAEVGLVIPHLGVDPGELLLVRRASSDQPRYSWRTWLRSTEAKAASSRRLKPRLTRWRSKRSWTCAGARSCIGLAVEEPFQPLPSRDMPLMNQPCGCTKYRWRA